MMGSIKYWFFQHTLMEGGTEYFLERHMKFAKIICVYGVLTVLLFSYIVYDGTNLDLIILWAFPLLSAIFINIYAANARLSKDKTVYTAIFFICEVFAFIWWVGYVYIFGWYEVTSQELIFRNFLVFIVTLFYLNAMQYSMVFLLINSSITCLGLLIFLTFFSGMSQEHLFTSTVLILMGWFSLIRFGRYAYLLMCENYQAILDNKKLLLRMDDLLNHDPLTQQHNRRYFDEQMERYFSLFDRGGKAFCLCLIDIDHFKKVNDVYGHPVGDRILIEVGNVIRSNLRKSDVFARYGGEEFAIILPFASLESAAEVLVKVRRKIEEHTFDKDGYKLKITISLGLAVVTNNDDYNLLIQKADKALYRAKQLGRNTIQIAS